MGDRTSFVPAHGSFQDHVLPADPLFIRLLTLAHSKTSKRPMICDLNTGVEAGVDTLLCDVLRLRRVIFSRLCPVDRQNLQQGNPVFVAVCAPGGYEFSVATLAVLSLGACATLLSPLQPVDELVYYVNKVHAVALLAATSALQATLKLETVIKSSSNADFMTIPIREYARGVTIPVSSIVVSSDKQPDQNGPGVIIFTSGTTGYVQDVLNLILGTKSHIDGSSRPPKAVVLRRSTISTGAQDLGLQLGLQPTDTLLHVLPVHHATGLNLSFFPFIQAGACIQFKPGGFDASWIWDRWRRGDLTHFTGVPTIYMRLMRYYREHISKQALVEREGYRAGLSHVKVMFCGTSALPKTVDDFWRKLRDGRRIVQRYGSTETQIVINMPCEDNEDIPDGSVGKASVGTDIVLSEGTEGELLVKSPNMFMAYLNDEQATRASHNAEGYYKTGDLARKEGDYYFILGRASVDILKSGGYKISALDIEREIIALPYIGEVMVVGVPDDEFGQRVAAAVTLRNNTAATAGQIKRGAMLQLDTLRADLRARLAGYKLPTLLRVVEEELPKNATGKLDKKKLGPMYFPPDYRKNPEVQMWERRQRKL